MSIAFVFPGQGSQSVGMLSDLAQQFDEIETCFSEASAVLGYDLWQLTQNGPSTELDKTAHTQPALLTASYAIWRTIQDKNPIKAAALAGHSLGEYTALVCANAIAFQDAVKLVAARGRYMQDAVSQDAGAMAAIVGLNDLLIKEICEKSIVKDEVLSLANFNAIGQTVIAGHKQAVEKAIDLAKQHHAKLAVLLPVSVPSHCQLMEPAARRLAALLETIPITPPDVPVINNVDAVFYESTASIRDGLIRQLSMPVRWVEIIQSLSRQHVTHIVECGPGKVLTGLNKRIDKNIQGIAASHLESLQTLLQSKNKGALNAV